MEITWLSFEGRVMPNPSIKRDTQKRAPYIKRKGWREIKFALSLLSALNIPFSKPNQKIICLAS
jgi:hypothetical protein